MGNVTKDFTVGNGSWEELLETVSDKLIDRISELAGLAAGSDDYSKAIYHEKIKEVELCEQLIRESHSLISGYGLTYNDVIWLAGVFSVAGSIGVSPKRHKPFVIIDLREEAIISHIASLFGLKVVMHNGDYTPRYKVTLTGRNAVALLKLICPFTFGKNRSKIEGVIGNMVR